MFITLYSIKKRAAAVQNFRRCYSPHSPGERRPNMGKAKEILLCSRVHPTHILSLESVRPACKGTRTNEKFPIPVPLCSLSWRGPKLASQKTGEGGEGWREKEANREIEKKPILPPFFISEM